MASPRSSQSADQHVDGEAPKGRSASARTPRQHHREVTEREIVARATAQLAEVGPTGLSLRKIAREMDLVSSAVYRYFPSRDALLTRLILDGFNDYGRAVEVAEAEVPREHYGARFRAATGELRAWALTHPNSYALIYGSPVPGYHAPQETIAAASRAGIVLMRILEDAQAAGHVFPSASAMHAQGDTVAPLRDTLGPSLEPGTIALGVDAWSHLMGLVSFETFGQYRNMISDTARFYEAAVEDAIASFGL
ncbi:TetR/AcrR family transcriptional regulator [Leucobacter komagatae]|uniref:TetR/AcrR family transcriptional regulator n=1 Tax=Leucobacter komagatae TaxID=55969 RepID=UPI000A0374EF|nr:TetR/AcrR family transcriptional regulator [Leucobacter komagatae]